ncbi:MAG TPA: barstar family protein [Candidatus Methylomirabilis sp.]|nr:barstar family protein [Candidatus Methylomirabilis sp.]
MPLNPKRCVLSGKTVRSPETFYDEIARQLSLPGHFGRNLDALWDVLSADVPGPFEVVWEESKASREAMGKSFDRVVAVLRKVTKERSDFRLILR